MLRWHTITVDLDDAHSKNDVLAALEHKILLVLASGDEEMQHAVRIELRGRTGMHRDIVDAQATWHDLIQQVVADAGRDRVWIERIRTSTSPPLPAIETLREREDMVGELARELAELTTTTTMPAALEASLKTLREKITAALLEGEDALVVPGLSPGVKLDGVFEQVERDLLSRLVDTEVAHEEEGL